MGEHGALEKEHVRNCPECLAELARLESILAQFRNSARVLVGQAVPPADLEFLSVAEAEESWWSNAPRRWVLATAALVILVTVPFLQNARDRKRAVERAEADTLLMEQVDRAVSRTVPRPMEPLIELVRWGSSPTEGNDKR